MTKININPKSKNYNIILLYVILFFSCTSLIVINYITIRTLSASRAYINGESHYSKGQNKASRHLITYLFTEKNKKGDLDDLIWVFRYFSSVPFLKKAINEWHGGDELVVQLQKMGNEVHKK